MPDSEPIADKNRASDLPDSTLNTGPDEPRQRDAWITAAEPDALNRLFDVLFFVSRCPNVPELICGFGFRIKDLFDFDRCVIGVVRNGTELKFENCPLSEEDALVRAADLAGPERRAAADTLISREVIQITDADSGWSHLCLPMELGQGAANGVLLFSSESGREFEEPEIALARAVSHHLALAIDRLQRISELDRINRELERSNRELQEFAYIASHDLQEPVRAIISFSQLLNKRYSEEMPDDARQYFDFVTTGAARIKALIQDLLKYSRLESRASPSESVDLNEVFKEALESLHSITSGSEAQVSSGDLPVIEGDRLQLMELLRHLIENAIKFRGEDPPEVRITAERHSDAWVFSIRDNGMGIDPAHADRIFEIFKRLHSDDAFAGTGIGLAICRRIVHRHGGQIWLESGKGSGSEFRFSLPAVEMLKVVE